MGLFTKIFGTRSQRELKKIQPIVDQVLALEESYKNLSEDALKAKTQEFKDRLAEGETLNDLLTEAFAMLAKVPANERYNVGDYVTELAYQTGSLTLVGGQVLDLEGEGRNLTLEELRAIHNGKTTALITAAVRMGAMDGAVFPNIIHFTYQVDGVSYQGSRYVGLNPNFPRKGETLTVFYDASAPARYAVNI